MYHKVEGLEVLNPLGMMGAELVLTLYELERLMIKMQDELGPNQIMPPMLPSSHYGIKLFIISGELSLSLI